MPLFEAAIFDMDGTLVDNMAAHAQAWVQVSRRLGAPQPAATFARDWAGQKNEEIFERILGRPVTPTEVRELSHEKESLYQSLYQPHLRALDGAIELLAALKAAGVRCAVATAAPEANRELVLGGLQLHRYLDAVVGPEGAARGKPAPDIFLAAAAALKVTPGAAVVFEDALNGVRAARAAGMEVAAVTTTAEPAALEEVGARWILRDFTALPSDLSRRLRL